MLNYIIKGNMPTLLPDRAINYNYHEFSKGRNDLSRLKLKNCLSPEGHWP